MTTKYNKEAFDQLQHKLNVLLMERKLEKEIAEAEHRAAQAAAQDRYDRAMRRIREMDRRNAKKAKQ